MLKWASPSLSPLSTSATRFFQASVVKWSRMNAKVSSKMKPLFVCDELFEVTDSVNSAETRTVAEFQASPKFGKLTS